MLNFFKRMFILKAIIPITPLKDIILKITNPNKQFFDFLKKDTLFVIQNRHFNLDSNFRNYVTLKAVSIEHFTLI